jgi:uncharacterized cupin superfamily protein
LRSRPLMFRCVQSLRSIQNQLPLAWQAAASVSLAPGGSSALRHAHTKQDEFVYILSGMPTLHTDRGQTQLAPGMCAGFKAGSGDAHRLVNNTQDEVVYLEVGDRTAGDEASYPDDDIQAALVVGKWMFTHKNGEPYKT